MALSIKYPIVVFSMSSFYADALLYEYSLFYTAFYRANLRMWSGFLIY